MRARHRRTQTAKLFVPAPYHTVCCLPKRNGILAALGLNVRRAREAKIFTQEKLAEKAGLDPTYISGIESGLRNPGIKNVARLAKALGLSTAELCKGVDA